MQEKGEAEKLKDIKKSQSVSSEAVAKLTSGLLVLEKYFSSKLSFFLSWFFFVSMYVSLYLLYLYYRFVLQKLCFFVQTIEKLFRNI